MKHKTSKSVAAAALLTVVVFNFSALCVAATQTWQIDPNHTAAQFSVRHLGISTVRGVFEKIQWNGELRFVRSLQVFH